MMRHGDTIEITADDTFGTGVIYRAAIMRGGRYMWADTGFTTPQDALARALDMVRTAERSLRRRCDHCRATWTVHAGSTRYCPECGYHATREVN